ncbi:uncharacterized protein LOC144872463 [Branchiostoma floridae x Branchiostoma japonicum]
MTTAMISSLLQSGLGDVTDPARLHAELWADYVCKVVSCWLPLLVSTIVVGRELLGSSMQCFPLNLVQGTAHPENGTFVSDSNSTTNTLLGSINMYTRQLSEFVNVYCAGEDSFSTNAMFSYQLFAMMLVIQAAVMYAPVMIWNITIGRKIICNVRFIARDTEVLYDRFRKQDDQRKEQDQDRGQGAEEQEGLADESSVVYGQEELLEAEREWRGNHTIYLCYIAKQTASAVFTVVFLGLYWWHPIFVGNIHEKFLCSVENDFSVTCTVPAAKVYRFAWIINIILLALNTITVLLHVTILHASAADQPFTDIGIKNEALRETRPGSIVQLNDSYMMDAFFKANIESIEKYNYVRNIPKVSPKRRDI